MTNLSDSLSVLKPLFFTDAQKQACEIFEQCINHLDNQFILLYLLDAKDGNMPNESIFFGSVHEGQIGNWHQPGLDFLSALGFITELALELKTTDKLQRLCMMVYDMDSTPLTIPNFEKPDYAYLWQLGDGVITPSDEGFFAYDETLFETVPGPAMVDGVMTFVVPEVDLVVQKEREAAKGYADDLTHMFFHHLVVPKLPNGIHNLSMVFDDQEIRIDLVKVGEALAFNVVSMPVDVFTGIMSDLIYRNEEFRFLLRSSTIVDPMLYINNNSASSLSDLEATFASWKFEGRNITPMSAQDTIDYLFTAKDGTVITPPKNFSYIDAWAESE